RHRAGPALIFMWRQLARTRTRGKILHLVGDDGKRLLLRLAHHWGDQPAGYRNRNPDVGMLVPEQGAFGPGHVGVRDALERERKRLDDEIVDRNLVGRLAVLVLRRGGFDLLARRHELTDIALEREIEMRDGKLRFEEAPRDHLADIVVRDCVVRAGLEQRADLLVGGRLHGRRERAGGGRRGGSCDPTAPPGRLPLPRGGAARRARTLDAGRGRAGRNLGRVRDRCWPPSPADAPGETRRRGSCARSEPSHLPLLPAGGKRQPPGLAAWHAPRSPRPFWARTARVPRDVLKRP